MIARAVPVAAAALAIVLAMMTLNDGPIDQSIRAADDGSVQDGGGLLPGEPHVEHKANVDAGGGGAADKRVSALQQKDGVAGDLPGSLSPPAEPAKAASGGRGTYLVEDPEGDEVPENDSLDIRYGGIDYRPGHETLQFVSGLTRLSAAPDGVAYHWMLYDEDSYDVIGFRTPDGQLHVEVQNERCTSCSMTFDLARNEATIIVPLEVLNDYVTRNQLDGGVPSPPVAKGRTFGGLTLRAHAVTSSGGPDFTKSPLGPNDIAERTESWTVE